MAACGEQLIKKTGITPARLKAHYKRCQDWVGSANSGIQTSGNWALHDFGDRRGTRPVDGVVWDAGRPLQGVPDGKNAAAEHAQDKRRLWRR